MRGMHLTAIGEGSILLEPGAGLDPNNIDLYLEPLMSFLQQQKARKLIYDLKNVPLIDTIYYNWLVYIHRLCSISGMGFIVANMQPTAAFALSTTIKETPPFICALDVESARLLEPT